MRTLHMLYAHPYMCLMCILHAPYMHFMHALFPQPPLHALYAHPYVGLLRTLHALFSPHHPYVCLMCTLCVLQVYDWLRVPTTANQITDI